MKKFYLITLILFVTAFASSCSKDDTQTNSAVKAQFAAKDLDESLRIFNTLKLLQTILIHTHWFTFPLLVT